MVFNVKKHIALGMATILGVMAVGCRSVSYTMEESGNSSTNGTTTTRVMGGNAAQEGNNGTSKNENTTSSGTGVGRKVVYTDNQIDGYGIGGALTGGGNLLKGAADVVGELKGNYKGTKKKSNRNKITTKEMRDLIKLQKQAEKAARKWR